MFLNLNYTISNNLSNLTYTIIQIEKYNRKKYYKIILQYPNT